MYYVKSGGGLAIKILLLHTRVTDLDILRTLILAVLAVLTGRDCRNVSLLSYIGTIPRLV